MNILDLASSIGLQPKRTSSTNGGEYKSACPQCNEGKDRFCIWPCQGVAGKYWCRMCNCKGDAIQFCRDFLGMTYLDACRQLNVSPKQRSLIKGYNPFKKSHFFPQDSKPLPEEWRIAAKAFIERCHDCLLSSQAGLNLLEVRGITKETISTFRLGWNLKTIYDNRSSWGMPIQFKEDGRVRKQWLPQGIVIPSLENGILFRIKIRRSEWHLEDKLPKYAEVSGGLQRPSIYGDYRKPFVVLESELDAIVIQQFASDLCCCLSLGGVSKRPDKQVHELLCKAPLILLALDYDEAGKKEYPFWMSLYPNLRPWPARKGKSPGDSYTLYGVDLRRWVQDGLCYLC